MSVHDSDESSFSQLSSYSDQTFKVLLGSTLHSSRVFGDSVNNDEECKTTARDSLGDTGKPKEGYLSTKFSCSLFQKDICAGKVVIYPKCMHRMLSRKYPEILSALEETYGLGAFIYVGGSFQCLFPRHPQRFHKIKTELICDMCIFANNKPAILLTVAKDKKQSDNLNGYNLQMKRNLEEWISKTLVEFKALSVVVTPDDLRIRGHFKQIISYAETHSRTKVLPSTLGTVILTMETFFRRLATCKFVQRFYGVSEETVYLDQDLFEEFIELMEAKNTKTVYSKCSNYIMLLACELGYRLALIGHTSIYSRSEEKREFEELRKAQNLSIAISYDRSGADESLEEGDVRLSSWRGGTILFRSGIAAARRTLASAVVNRSAKVQDEERRNRLMDLVCLHMKRAEEQLENTLRRADSKSQIAELESFNTYSRDEETQMYPVGKLSVAADAPDILGFKDSTVQEDLDLQYIDSQTSESRRQMAKTEEAKYEEYPLRHFDHMTPSQSTQRDEATCISSVRLDRPTFSHLEGTMHNISSALTDSHNTNTSEQRPSPSYQNRGPANTPYTTIHNTPTRSKSTNARQQRPSPSYQHRDPANTPYNIIHNTPTRGKSTNTSEQRPSPSHQHRGPANTPYTTIHNTPTRSKSTNAREQRPSPSHQHRDPANTPYTTIHNTPTRGKGTNASEQRPSTSHQHRDPANTPYTTIHNTPTRGKSTNASEQGPSTSHQHRDPANTSYITNQDTSTRHQGFPKDDRNAGNESHIIPKGGQSCLPFVSESCLTNEGNPNASGDSVMTSRSVEHLSAIPRYIVTRKSTPPIVHDGYFV